MAGLNLDSVARPRRHQLRHRVAMVAQRRRLDVVLPRAGAPEAPRPRLSGSQITRTSARLHLRLQLPRVQQPQMVLMTCVCVAG